MGEKGKEGRITGKISRKREEGTKRVGRKGGIEKRGDQEGEEEEKKGMDEAEVEKKTKAKKSKEKEKIHLGSIWRKKEMDVSSSTELESEGREEREKRRIVEEDKEKKKKSSLPEKSGKVEGETEKSGTVYTRKKKDKRERKGLMPERLNGLVLKTRSPKDS